MSYLFLKSLCSSGNCSSPHVPILKGWYIRALFFDENVLMGSSEIKCLLKSNSVSCGFPLLPIRKCILLICYKPKSYHGAFQIRSPQCQSLLPMVNILATYFRNTRAYSRDLQQPLHKPALHTLLLILQSHHNLKVRQVPSDRLPSQ